MESILIFVIRIPLRHPQAYARTKIHGITITGEIPAFTINHADKIPDIPAIPATERSIPPVSSTSVCPNATIVVHEMVLINVDTLKDE